METIVNVQNHPIEGTGGSISSISRLYLFLGRCFSYPEEGFCEAMKDERLNDEIRALVEELPFEVKFRGIPAPSLPQDELESEYISSFDLGFSPSLPCPLYESDYRSGELSRVEILEELLRFHEHFDIQLSDREKDYPDHLVAELEFMAFLAKKEADAIGGGKAPDPYRLAQRDFLERHLNRWVYQLHERVQKRLKEPFYQGASPFMVEFLSHHQSYLETLNQEADRCG